MDERIAKHTYTANLALELTKSVLSLNRLETPLEDKSEKGTAHAKYVTDLYDGIYEHLLKKGRSD